MSFYFVCPGEAAVTAKTVQCSVEIKSVDASVNEPMWSAEDTQGLINAVILIGTTLAVIWLIKKAIDI
jgi:hypothetical protein